MDASAKPGFLFVRSPQWLSGNQEIAPQSPVRQVIAPVGEPHPGLTMQRYAPATDFYYVIHRAPFAASRVACICVFRNRRTVLPPHRMHSRNSMRADTPSPTQQSIANLNSGTKARHITLLPL